MHQHAIRHRDGRVRREQAHKAAGARQFEALDDHGFLATHEQSQGVEVGGDSGLQHPDMRDVEADLIDQIELSFESHWEILIWKGDLKD